MSLTASEVTEQYRNRNRDRNYRSFHGYNLLLACFAVVLSFILTPAPRHGESVKLFSLVFPPSCPSYILFKQPCHGCGLTRSFVAFAHGRWEEAIEFHRLGPLFFFAALFQIPYRTWRLKIGPGILPVWLDRFLLYSARIMLIALVGNWFLLVIR